MAAQVEQQSRDTQLSGAAPQPAPHTSEVTHPPSGRPRVVIVGAGFGGLAAARRLAHAPVDVVLVDRHNYHLFTPLLYQVATAGLEPEEIAHPVRAILRGQRNARFLVADVQGVDLDGRVLRTDAGELNYDYLILAAGSTTNFFGMESVETAASGLKDVDEAMALRNQILACFEAAAWEKDAARRRSLLTFVVVGGGPTGVEFAGALSELVSRVLPRDYPDLDFTEVRVLLLEAADHLLGMFSPRLQRYALRVLRRRGVEVRLGAAVDRVEDGRIVLKDGTAIPAETVMWAAGVRAGELAAAVPAPRAGQGRLRVLPTLQVEGRLEVFVVGDMAATGTDGASLPMLAPVAQQEGRRAADNIANLVAGEQPAPFDYRNRGTMATIGRNAAVAQIGPLSLTGFVAWIAWLGLHIVTLIGFRNRMLVLVNWAWDYFRYERAVRLILGAGPGDRPVQAERRAVRE